MAEVVDELMTGGVKSRHRANHVEGIEMFWLGFQLLKYKVGYCLNTQSP